MTERKLIFTTSYNLWPLVRIARRVPKVDIYQPFPRFSRSGTLVVAGLNFLDTCNVSHYSRTMITSFRHAGLEKYFKTGSKAGIQPAHAKKLTILLTALNIAGKPEEMDQPGWRFHDLKGDQAGRWSVKVNGNWRVTFRFEGEHAVIVDYEDYHR